MGHDFVWDDFYLIVDDYTVKSFKYLDTIFTSDFFGHQEDELAYGYFRPLVSLSYAIDYALWQKNPLGFHLANILLHAVASVSVALLLMQLGMREFWAFGAALLFAVHPIHIENAAWISGRTDILAFVLSLFALLSHLFAARRKKAFFRHGVSLFFFAAALLAKETAVVSVLWLGAIQLFFLGRKPGRALLSTVPYLLVVLLYVVWRFVIADVAAPFQPPDVTLLDKIAVAPWTVARYLAWLLAPVCQSAYVQNPYIAGPGDIRLYVGIAAVLGFCLAAYKARKILPSTVGFVWMLGISFLPILNFISISGPEDMGAVMAERFLYFPSFPFVALIATVAEHSTRRARGAKKGRIVVSGAIAAVLLASAAATVAGNRVWKNNEVFYRATLEAAPSALIWSNLANHYIHEGQWDKAKKALAQAEKYSADDYHYLSSTALFHATMREYQKAIEIQKKVADRAKRGRAVAYNNLAFLYRMIGDAKRAEALLLEVIDNHRGYADVYFNLAEIYRSTGRHSKAEAAYRQALKRRPDNLRMAVSFAGMLMEKGKLEEAARVFETQLSMDRNNPGLLNNLGVVFKKMNRPDRARALFEQSLEQDSSYTKARLNLAGILLSMQKKQRASRHLQKIVKQSPDSPEAKTAEKILNNLNSETGAN